MKCGTRVCKKETVGSILIRDYDNKPIIVIKLCKRHLKELYDSGFFDDKSLSEQKEKAEELLGMRD